MAAFKLIPAFLILAACKELPDERHPMPGSDPKRGRDVMARAGCGSCHDIPGVWPRGTLGPPLTNFAEQGLIAGRLPNRPDVLMAFLRDAPAMIPGSTMPAMPIDEGEARDAAAYLYTLRRR